MATVAGWLKLVEQARFFNVFLDKSQYKKVMKYRVNS